MPETPTPTPPAPPPPQPRRKLGNLLMVWRYASRYPLQIVAALIALVVAAVATLWIPRTFQKVIDNGFAAGADPASIAPYFQGLIGVVLALALASAARFYFVSWLGERTVADVRIAVQRSEEHTSELQSIMRISYAVFCLKKKNK